MPNPIELEVTLRITVDREWFDPMSDAAICDHIQETQAQIYNSNWNTVTVRVAEDECNCFACQAARCHYQQAMLEFPCSKVGEGK